MFMQDMASVEAISRKQSAGAKYIQHWKYYCYIYIHTFLSSGVRRKFASGRFHSVAYGGHLSLVCGLCEVTIWRHIHVSKPPFWRSLL